LFLFFPTGAEKLVKHLHQHKVPIAIASGSDHHNFELKTVNHRDLFGLFHHAVLSSSDPEVKHGKPAPDCFLIAAARFPEPPKPENVSTVDSVLTAICPQRPSVLCGQSVSDSL
jgi:pseudouridine-5'-monophosphatase